jgi:Pyridoxamine 5'-phosphate oxidase
MPAQGQLTELPRDEAMLLLGRVTMGRLVFTMGGLPTVRPVNHELDDAGAVIIRTRAGSAALTCAGSIVAYEADTIDPETHTGWTVIVTGVAELIEEPEPIACDGGALTMERQDYVLRIGPEVISGFELVPPP